MEIRHHAHIRWNDLIISGQIDGGKMGKGESVPQLSWILLFSVLKLSGNMIVFKTSVADFIRTPVSTHAVD
jgi:hypothetical protein